ncbi:MAG: right-handed parallel beta-helix repeat-containing protein [bacterium]
MTSNEPGSNIVDVLDFGIRADGEASCTEAVIAAVAACREIGPDAVLYFPPGRYNFWPLAGHERDYYESNTEVVNPRRLAMLFDDLHDFILDGGGSRFIFHDRIQPISVERCSNITLQHLSIDWQVPMGAEAEVVAVTAEYIDLQIDPLAHPFEIENDAIFLLGEGWREMIGGVHPFMADGIHCLPGGGDGWLNPGWHTWRATRLADNRVRMYGAAPPVLHVGSWLVLRCGARDHAGIFLTESQHITINDLSLHHCTGLGILAQYCENLYINEYRVEPSPARHVLSGHDDGLQVSNCRGQVQVRNCRFRGLMDDPINVHGTSVAIIRRSEDGTALRCRFMHSQAIGMPWGHPGDEVAVISPENMLRLAVCTIDSFTMHDEREFTITCAAGWPAAAQPVFALENLTWAPEVEIRDSEFLGCRARGVLVTTPRPTLITNNLFASSGSAILISGDAHQWYESGAVQDVRIIGNTFESHCLQSKYQFCEGIISIDPHIEHPDPAAPAHKNITIEGNTFHPTGQPLLYACSVENLTFTHNTIIPSADYPPWHPRHTAIALEACLAVEVHDNQVQSVPGGAHPALEIYEEALLPHSN